MLRLFVVILSFFFFESSSFSKDEYFLTLRNEKVNLRQGPSFEYPVKIFYKKKYLPVLIEDTFENFRKIKDHENNTGWIHISQLSKKKAAIVMVDDLIVFNKPTVFSAPNVILRKGRIFKVIKCKKNWCKIKVDKYKGWIKKDSLWGLL